MLYFSYHMSSSSVIYIRHLFQINMFARPLRILQAMENFEVLGLRLPYVNFVLNPWLCILLSKKKSAIFLSTFPCMRKCCQRPIKYNQISVTVNIHVLFIYMFYLVCYKAKDKFHLKCERMPRLNLYT